jgi:hypothetical protein
VGPGMSGATERGGVDPRDPQLAGAFGRPPWRWRMGNAALQLSARLLRAHPIVLDTQPHVGPADTAPARNRAIEMLLARRADAFRDAIDTIGGYGADLRRIPVAEAGRASPWWGQDWFTSLDAAALYAFIRERRPQRYHEIGSGNSTLFAAQAIRDGELGTRILSVDPKPRADIDLVCDEIVRTPLQDSDLGRVGALTRGDVVLLDSSHYAITNSDVVAFFLDVVPSLEPGVLVGIHDVFLPDDYPWWLSYRWYSEQYMLAAWLLGAGDALKTTLASHYCATEPSLRTHLDDLWQQTGLPRLAYGSTFWFET